MAEVQENSEQRKKELAMIHIGKKELGLDDDLYRAFLKQLCGKESSAELDGPSRRLVLAAMRGRGAFKRKSGRPHNFNEPSRHRMMTKIGALLAEAKYPWSYADTLAKRFCKVDRLAFVPVEKLYKIITALVKDAERKGRRLG